MRLDRAEILASLPPAWPDDLLPAIQQQAAASRRKIVVLDDDPTGTQTVHGVPVLTEWPVERLQAELADEGLCCYLLTNSRSLPPREAEALNATIGHNLVRAARRTGRPFAVVSRSDSTLRGHFPGEVAALAGALAGGQGGEFDAWLLVPFFLEGGRYTLGDVHYVAEGEQLIPAAETPYAQDATFSYRASNLRAWVAEKTGGRVAPENVATISLDDLRRGGPERVTARLLSLPCGAICAVNAASYRDLEVLVLGLLAAEAQGRRYLYRTAASFVRVRAGIAPRPLLTAADLKLPATGGGLFVVGSHVPLSTRQVNDLLAQPGVAGVEINVARLLEPGGAAEAEIARAAQATDDALRAGQDVALFTSRELVAPPDGRSALAVSKAVSDGVIAVLQRIPTRPRYLVAKGGITSSDVATRGLHVRRATVMGQILPGVPVWWLGAESRYPQTAYVVFPGNVGGPDALAAIRSAFRPGGGR